MSANRDISSDQLARVAALVADASSSSDIAAALAILIDGLVDLTAADRAAVLFEHEDHLVSCYADRRSQDDVGVAVAVDGSLAGVCYRMGAPVISDDVTRDRRFAGLDRAVGEVSLIAIPLHLEGPPLGVVRVICAEPGRFGGRELTTARLVVAAMRKILLQRVRIEREALGIRDKDFTTAGVWALRNRRKIQLEHSATDAPCVSLVR